MKSVFFCLTSDIHEEDKEILFGILFSHNTLGCEEIERTNGISVKSYFDDKQAARQTENNIVKYIPNVTISSDEINFIDWNKDWKDSIDPILLTEKIWVSPGFCKPDLKKNDTWIKIEPKMAFGTGRHETTRLAAQALVSVNRPKKKSFLLDIGTGSGILCFVGNILGYTMSFGIENDMWCRSSLIENRNINNASIRTSFSIGSIQSIREKEYFDIIVVNIVRESSEEIVRACEKYLLKDGYLIWSGLLYDEQDSIKQFLRSNGWSILDVKNENKWMCYILYR